MEGSRKSRPISAGLLAISIATMLTEWILLTGTAKRDEMILGSLSIAASLFFLAHTFKVSSGQLEIRLKDLLEARYLPWMMINDTWVVTVVLLRDLLGLEPAHSLYRVLGFQTSKHDAHRLGRQVLATVYATSTPNSIVVGTDPATSRMLVHQLRRAATPKLLRDLGGQS